MSSIVMEETIMLCAYLAIVSYYLSSY